MKRIYINGRFLTQNITGVQRCAVEFVKVIDKYLDDENFGSKYSFQILAPKNINQKLELKNIEIKKVGYLKGHLWEQLELPSYTKNNFLFNFCNCAPIFKQNQAVTIHDAAVAAVPEAYSFLFRTWYKIMFRFLNHSAKCIFTDSNFSKEELKRYFSMNMDKVKVIYCGIDHMLRIKPDEKVFAKHNIEKEKYVLGVSSVHPAKNFKLILKAAQKLPDVNFIIAGGNNSKVFKTRGLETPDNVRFIGYVSDEELVALYKYAYCFIFPSIYEGFGLPPLEAMVFNCPVISSDIKVLREMAENHALYCDINDENILVKQIKRVDDLKALRKANNREFVLNKFNWQSAVDKMLDSI